MTRHSTVAHAETSEPTPQPARSALRILVIGEEHVRSKVARHYRLLEERYGIRTHFYVDDRSGITRETAKSEPMHIRYAPNPASRAAAVLQYWRGFLRYFDEVRPDVLEIYSSINFKVIYPMVLYAAMRGVPRVVVCRGELYEPVFQQYSRLNRGLFVRILRMANLLIYKELYMDETLQRLSPDVPRLYWHNAIPVRDEPQFERRNEEVLFLNFFKPWRNLELIVEAAPLVRERVPNVRFRLVGGADQLTTSSGFYSELYEYEKRIRTLIDARDAGDFVEILPFTTDVEPHFRSAKVFLLPADLVFCNYALLEAMERGVPAIVSADRDENARLIVEDGVDGRVVPLDATAWADAIVRLLTDEVGRQRMGRAARDAISRRYNLANWIEQLANRYHQLARRSSAQQGA